MRIGLRSADLGPRRPAQRLPSLEPAPAVSASRRTGQLLRRGAVGLAGLATVGGAFLAVEHIGVDRIGRSLVTSSPTWVLVGLALMCVSMLFRAVSWHAILKAALPDTRPRLTDAWQGTAVGVLMSATLPARLGEPSRALIVARRLGRPREALPVVIGTLVSQTLLNVLALVILGAVMFSTVGLFAGREQALIWYAVAPIVVLLLVLVAPALVRSGLPKRSARVGRWMRQARAAATRVRHGLIVFRRPRMGSAAVTMQLGAWALQLVSCYVLMVALGLDAQGRRPRRRRRGPVRGQRERRAPADAVEPRRLPGRVRARAQPRLRHLLLRRARLRDHPAGGRGRDRGRARRAGAGQGGRVVARGAAPRAAHRAGRAVGACRAAPRRGRAGSRLPRAAAVAAASCGGHRGRRVPGVGGGRCAR